MSQPKFVERFVTIKEAVEASLEDGRLTIPEGLGIAQLIMNTGKEVLASMEDDTFREDIIVAAEWAFDEYVVPYDAPLNDMVEAMLEKLLRGLIRPAIEGV